MASALLSILGVFGLSMVVSLVVTNAGDFPMTLYQVLSIIGPIIGVFIGFYLRGRADRVKQIRAIESHLAALEVEVYRCGELAATYFEQGINAPLYRLPTSHYESSMLILKNAGIVTKDDAQALQHFYSQADQVNRGLDNVDDFKRGRLPDNEAGINSDRELRRLKLKAREMQAAGAGSPDSEWYEDATLAVDRLKAAWRKL